MTHPRLECSCMTLIILISIELAALILSALLLLCFISSHINIVHLYFLPYYLSSVLLSLA